MTGNKQSYLARHAQHLLYTPIPKEADPNNLAPTASTTAQMALGDAIATALLALRGFTPRDFAQFHPGGALGKQLYLKVKNLYPNNERPQVAPEESLRKTILEITSKRLGATAVVNAQGQLCGIVTDGDLRRMLEKQVDIHQIKAQDIMTTSPKVIQENDMAAKALLVMRKNSITQLIVVNKQNQYLGIVHLHDLIREGLI
jgi:arabinose-5-phosphate isomerase